MKAFKNTEFQSKEYEYKEEKRLERKEHKSLRNNRKQRNNVWFALEA